MFLEVSKFVPLHTPITDFFGAAASDENNRLQEEEPGMGDKEHQTNDDDDGDSHSHGTNKLKSRDSKTRQVTVAAGRLFDPETEVFLAELPPDVSREVRIQLEFERLNGNFAGGDAKKERNSLAGTSDKKNKRPRTVGPLDAFLGK